MTRPQQLQPLRCETCNNKKCPEYKQRAVTHLQYIDNNCIDSKNGSPKEYRVYSPKYFTELYGCASHSSAPAAIRAEAARKAREDVLDNICHNCGGLADGAEQCNSCCVKSLRGERE